MMGTSSISFWRMFVRLASVCVFLFSLFLYWICAMKMQCSTNQFVHFYVICWLLYWPRVWTSCTGFDFDVAQSNSIVCHLNIRAFAVHWLHDQTKCTYFVWSMTKIDSVIAINPFDHLIFLHTLCDVQTEWMMCLRFCGNSCWIYMYSD